MPTVPVGKLDVVIVSGGSALNAIGWVAICAPLVTWHVGWVVPAIVAVPLSVPLLARARPAVSAPAESVQLYVPVPPVATRLEWYGWPMIASSSGGVVATNGGCTMIV